MKSTKLCVKIVPQDTEGPKPVSAWNASFRIILL